MRTEKNPFETIGLSSQVLKGLSTEEIIVLAKQLYRGWMMIRHQDRGGSQQENAALNDAIAEIEKPESVMFWVEDAKKPQQKKLRETADKAIAYANVMEQRLVEYLSKMASLPQAVIIGEGSILVHDVMRTKMLSDMIKKSDSRTVTNFSYVPETFFELEINPDGTLQCHTLVEVRIQGSTEECWHVGTAKKRLRLKRSGTTKSPDYRLVGTISNLDLNISRDKTQGFQSLLPSSQYMASEKITDPTRGYSLDEFRPYLEKLCPRFSDQYDILIGMEPFSQKFFVVGRRTIGEFM